MCRSFRKRFLWNGGCKNHGSDIANVLKRYGKEGVMDGKRIKRTNRERPIAKPRSTLPMIFDPSKRSELPTKRGAEKDETRVERAHFYRRRASESGAPVYGFFITSENAGCKNPGPRF